MMDRKPKMLRYFDNYLYDRVSEILLVCSSRSRNDGLSLIDGSFLKSGEKRFRAQSKISIMNWFLHKAADSLWFFMQTGDSTERQSFFSCNSSRSSYIRSYCQIGSAVPNKPITLQPRLTKPLQNNISSL